jgi:streptogramin lyase
VSEWDGGTISRVPKSGGSPLALATGLRHPNGVAVDREHVYWSTASNQGIVARTPKRGGATAILAHRQAGPVRVLVDHDHVWWSLEYERSVVRLGR